MLGASLPAGQPANGIVGNYHFLDSTGTAAEAGSIGVSFPVGAAFLDASNILGWSRGGLSCGGYELGPSSSITFDTDLGPIGSIAFYLGVKNSGYSSGTVTIDFSGQDGVFILGGSASSGDFNLSFTSQEVTIAYPAGTPSQVLWVCVAFNYDNVVLSGTLPITYA